MGSKDYVDDVSIDRKLILVNRSTAPIDEPRDVSTIQDVDGKTIYCNQSLIACIAFLQGYNYARGASGYEALVTAPD